MEILGGLIAKWLPTKFSKIQIQESGDTVAVTVDGVGELKSTLLKDEGGRAMTLQNAGFASVFQFDNLALQVAPSGTRWTDPDMPHPIETRSGAVASLSWSVS
jgi:hypothetical protein